MVEIKTPAIIIAKQKFKENSIIITFFTQQKGLLKGVFNGATSKKNVYLTQIGNLVQLTWVARLENHLGRVSLDLEKSFLPQIFSCQNKLLALKSICDLLTIFLAEQDAMLELYQFTQDFLNDLEEDNTLINYIKWELNFLRCLGYGLNISTCGLCGKKHPEIKLSYVSPKSGIAVCNKKGEPYKDKLLKIPSFFNTKQVTNIPTSEIEQAFKLTGYFLNRTCYRYHKNLPVSRNLLQRGLLRS